VGLTDVAGTARQSIFYDAWGNERDRIGSSANNFTFTGHELDEETGLIYAKARFYDSEVGRFLSQDDYLGASKRPPSLHRYFYANANPLGFIDQTGLTSQEAQDDRWKRLEQARDQYVSSGGQLDPAKPLPDFSPRPEPQVVQEDGIWDYLKEGWAQLQEFNRGFSEWVGEQTRGRYDRWRGHTASRSEYVEQQYELLEETTGFTRPELGNEIREVELEVVEKGAEGGTRYALESAEFGAAGKLASAALPVVGRVGRRAASDVVERAEDVATHRSFGTSARNAARVADDVPLVFDGRRWTLRSGFVHDDYVRWVRGRGAKQATFDTPWSASRGLGTRRFDDFDPRTGTAFEGNTTPWSQMTQQQLSRKLDQAASDYTLIRTDRNVNRVVWFGTEELPKTGLGGQLRVALQAAGIEYWVVRP
jgi:RHS repeat-associated protein